MVNRVLLVAFHYPPVRESSGLQRTLKFSQYLPEFGWEPAVLSAHPRAYVTTGDEQLHEIPAGMPLKRAFAFDTARHFALAGRYPGFLALPDRWAPWWLGAVVSGLALIRQLRPRAIWSTYPIATAHLIGATLARLSGLPWIADMRDSMTEPGYPEEAAKRRWYLRIERWAAERAAKVVFTAPGALRMYAERYPHIPAERWAVIGNGYDEENFTRAAAMASAPPAASGHQLRLVHSGILYPSERDPRPFFAALAELRRRGVIDAANLRIVLRATGHDALHREHVAAAGIADLVEFAPSIPYEAALAEMLAADGLLLFQAANCNHQIPAKLYEYLRAGRPVFALTDRAGDTATTLLQAGIDTLVPLDDATAIAQGLERFVARVRDGSAPAVTPAAAAAYSRYARTRELAVLLDEVTSGRPLR